MKLSIIIPVFNEKNTLEKVIENVKAVELNKEIIVIDDGSTDGTKEILRRINGISKHFHEKNMGKGAAIHTGIKYVTGDVVAIQDADLEQYPDDLKKMFIALQENGYDAVFGSRMKGNFKPGLRYLANWLFSFLTNLLYQSHLTDIMTGYKMCRSYIIKDLELKSKGFDIEPEITAKLLKKGIKIHEIPVSYSPRGYDKGKKIRFVDSFKVVKVLLLCRF